jgi:hypothetical protein
MRNRGHTICVGIERAAVLLEGGVLVLTPSSFLPLYIR